jgi:hypothetical protein
MRVHINAPAAMFQVAAACAPHSLRVSPELGRGGGVTPTETSGHPELTKASRRVEPHLVMVQPASTNDVSPPQRCVPSDDGGRRQGLVQDRSWSVPSLWREAVYRGTWVA